jgi:hypothetical protein
MNSAMARFRAVPRNKLRGALHDAAIVSYLSEVKRNFFRLVSVKINLPLKI